MDEESIVFIVSSKRQSIFSRYCSCTECVSRVTDNIISLLHFSVLSFNKSLINNNFSTHYVVSDFLLLLWNKKIFNLSASFRQNKLNALWSTNYTNVTKIQRDVIHEYLTGQTTSVLFGTSAQPLWITQIFQIYCNCYSLFSNLYIRLRKRDSNFKKSNVTTVTANSFTCACTKSWTESILLRKRF